MIPNWYQRTIIWSALALTIAGTVIAGFRRLELLIAVIVLVMPVDIVWSYVVYKILPVPLTEIAQTPRANEASPDSILGRR